MHGLVALPSFCDHATGNCGPQSLIASGKCSSFGSGCDAILHSEERYRRVFETSVDAIAINRAVDGRYYDCNQSFLDTVGYTREELLGRTSNDLGIWVDRADRARLFEVLLQDSPCRDLEARFRRKSGEIFWGRMSASLIEFDGESCILSVTRDISETKASESHLSASIAALRLSEQRYHTVFENCFDGILISRIDNGNFVDVNPKCLDFLGYQHDEVIGKSSVDLHLWANPEDRTRMYKLLHKDHTLTNFETLIRKKNGEISWALLSASTFEIDGVPCLVTMARDISTAKAAEKEIRDLAFFDQLTHLANRRMLLDRLRQALAAYARNKRTGAVLFIDLDDFKSLNDSLGHGAGDLLLRETARRISACTDESGFVGRLGGDEFVVILENLSANLEDAAACAERVAEKLRADIAQPYLLAGRECVITSSIGIALFGDGHKHVDDIMQQADLALYQAKAAGRNASRFFAPALQSAVNARVAMEEDLRRAIGTSQLQLFYQPQVRQGSVASAEALLRWKHPTRGYVPPCEFIPLAEKTGLILPLGQWILETAFAQAAAWSQHPGLSQLSIAINISARQFRQPDFVAQVLGTLAATGANPQRIKFELTESMLVDNLDDITAKMAELKSYGLKLSIDDFGTGYSSLAYLSRLPLDELKIDRSFVQKMLVDTGSGAIAKTIIALSNSMGLSIIAEGVETEEQRDFLSRSGCPTYQGYLFSKALDAEEFERRVTAACLNIPLPHPTASAFAAVL